MSDRLFEREEGGLDAMSLWTHAAEVLNPHPRSRSEISATGVPTRSELGVAKGFCECQERCFNR